MFQTGIVKPGEICPGLTWEEHADSVARFMDRELEKELGVDEAIKYKNAVAGYTRMILAEIDADPQEVKDKYAKLERNS